MITKMKRKTSEERMRTSSYYSIQATLSLNRVQRKAQALRKSPTTKASKILTKVRSTSVSQAQTESKITNASLVLVKYHTINMSKRLIRCIKTQELLKRLEKQLNLTMS